MVMTGIFEKLSHSYSLWLTVRDAAVELGSPISIRLIKIQNSRGQMEHMTDRRKVHIIIIIDCKARVETRRSSPTGLCDND